MGGLFGNVKAAQQRPPETGIKIQSSVYGRAIALVYGTAKASGNLILYGNFQSVAINTGGGGGGKGGLFASPTAGTTSYSYFAAFAFAICEGPIVSVNKFWAGTDVFTLAQKNFSLFTGTYPQSAWGTTVSWSVTDQNGFVTSGTSTPLGYNGIAYCATPSYSLGESAQLPNLQFEVSGVYSTSVTGQIDADPSLVLKDFLTNVHYGLGFTSSFIGDLTLWQNYCIATALLVSPVYDSQRTGSDMIDELMVATNSACFWSSGKFNVTPYGDQPLTAGTINSANETDTVPNGSALGTYNVIRVAEAGTFVADQGVVYVSGGVGALTSVTTPPWNNQFGFFGLFPNIFNFAGSLAKGTYYQDNHGNYYFSNQDVGNVVTITYQWATQASYNPNITPLFSVGDDDFQRNPQNNMGASASAGSAGPVLLTRKRKSDTINSIKIEYRDRQNNYNPAICYANNQAEIDLYGLRTNGSKQLHLFCNAVAANLSANLQLRREMVRNTYAFDLDQRYIMLDPMDVIAITDSNLGLNGELVRIIQIQENDDGTLSFLCEEIGLGTGQAPAYSFGQQQGQAFINFNAAAGALNPPIIFEPTDELAGGLFIWAAVSGQLTTAAGWGGCNVWVSYDNVNYALAGASHTPARMGTTTAPLPTSGVNPIGQTIDSVHTLSVDLTESLGTLLSGTTLDATSLNTACYVGPLQATSGNTGEIVAYATASLTATNKYNLTYLVRGAFGTEDQITTWPTGSAFARLDQGIVKIPYDQSRIGSTIYLKFQSFNQWGGGLLALSQCTAYPYTILGLALTSPLPNVANFRSHFNNQTGFTDLDWDFVTDFRNGIVYEVRQGPTWDGGYTLGVVAHPPFTVPGVGTYWISARCQPVAGLLVYSETPQSVIISGGVITQNVIFTYDAAALHWPGMFSGGVGVDTSINALRTSEQDSILGAPNILSILDILNFDPDAAGEITEEASERGGIYYPTGASVNVGYVATVSVSIQYQPTGVAISQNILSITDFLSQPDILGTASAAFVTAYPLIETAGTTLAGNDLYAWQDLYQFADLYQTSSPAWSFWSKFSPGTYQAQYLNFAFFLESEDPAVIGYDLQFKITCTIPARIDQYSVTTSSGGVVTVTFQPAGAAVTQGFNGGSGATNTPIVQGTINNAQAGDDLQITNKSLTSLQVAVVNSGSNVVRTVELVVEGF